MRPERPVLAPATFCRDPLFVSSPLPKWVFDDETLAILAVNPAACRHYGWSESEFLGMTLFDIRPPEEAARLRRAVAEDLQKEFAYHPVVQLWRRDGERLSIEIHSTAVVFGDRPAHLTVARDVTARVKAEDGLRLYAKAIEACANGVLVTDARDPDMPIVLVNPAFEKITGFPAAEIIGRNCRFLQREDRYQPALEAMRQAIAQRQTYRDVLRNYRKSGEMFWNELSLAPLFDEHGELTHYVGIQNDVTPLRVEQTQLAYRDRHDELTGLPNRRDALEVIGNLIAECDASARQVNVAMLSIEHLHQVNDTFGYDAGDALVRDVANRALAVAIKHDAYLGRVGDEDFLLVSRSERGWPASHAARELVGALKAPFTVSGSPLHVTASAGVSTYPGSAEAAPALIQRANLAARRAKQAGRNQIVEFTAGMSEEVAERLRFSAALQMALPGRQLSLHVQPLVHVASGRLGGGEVLLRWTHPVHGLVSPARFIPLAEDSGLIVDIGGWVLQEALRLAATWRATELRPAPALAVNVSAVQFRRPEFVREVIDAVEASEIAPGSLKLEITEGVVMENADQATIMLEELRRAGVRISLDDFGTGHSSLGYLRKLPIDEIKIDRIFVRDVTVDAYASQLCTTIISMSRQLGLTVVAEGVETAEQAAFLKDAQCDLLQGFLFSRPLPAELFREMSGSNVSWSMDGRRIEDAR